MDPRYDKILDLVAQRSEAGEANWVPASEFGLRKRSEGDFYLNLSKGALRISEEESQGEFIICFDVINRKGESIFRQCDAPGGHLYEKLEKLLAMAHNSWFEVDETLESITSELRSAKRQVGNVPRSDDDIPF